MKFNAKKMKGDYKPPADEKLDDGSYNVVGIKWSFMSNGQPILKAIGSKLKGGFNYILENGESGPFSTVELHAMNKLQAAFNREAPFTIPPDESDAKAVSDFMIKVADNINNANTVKTIEVKDGYAQSYHLQIPANCEYNLRIVDIKKLDDGSYVYEKQWPSGISHYFKIRLRVESGKFGNPFAGNEFNVEVPYGIKIEDDYMQWTVDKEGKRTSESRIAESFYRFTAPDMMDSDFELDSDNFVEYWLKFVTVPSPVFKTFVKESVAKSGTIFYKPVWYKAEWMEDFDVPDVFKTAKDEEPKDEPVLESKRVILTDEEMDVAARDEFINMLSALADNQIVADGYQLNDLGKATAKKYQIKPAKITNMNHADVMERMNTLIESVEDKALVASYLQTVEELLIGGSANEFETDDSGW